MSLVARIALLGVSILLAGCYTAPVMPPPGLIYGNVKSVIDTDTDRTLVSKATGRASSYSILGLVSWGDSSVTAAAENGSLVTVNQVDYQFKNILGVYQRLTVIAKGTVE